MDTECTSASVLNAQGDLCKHSCRVLVIKKILCNFGNVGASEGADDNVTAADRENSNTKKCPQNF